MMRESDSIRKFATGVINDEKSLATLAELLIRDQKTRHFAFPRSLSLSLTCRRRYIFFALG
jgi:hypothetical protein